MLLHLLILKTWYYQPYQNKKQIIDQENQVLIEKDQTIHFHRQMKHNKDILFKHKVLILYRPVLILKILMKEMINKTSLKNC